MMEQPKQMVFLKNAKPELDKRLGPNDVNPYAIRAWVLQGKVKSVRAGRRVLVNMDALVRFLENGESAPTEQTYGIRAVPEKIR